jgi:hypothetical protein
MYDDNGIVRLRGLFRLGAADSRSLLQLGARGDVLLGVNRLMHLSLLD